MAGEMNFVNNCLGSFCVPAEFLLCVLRLGLESAWHSRPRVQTLVEWTHSHVHAYVCGQPEAAKWHCFRNGVCEAQHVSLQFPYQMKGLFIPTQLLPSCQLAWTPLWADGHDSEGQQMGEERDPSAAESSSKPWGFSPLPAPSPRLIGLAPFFPLPPKALPLPFCDVFSPLSYLWHDLSMILPHWENWIQREADWRGFTWGSIYYSDGCISKTTVGVFKKTFITARKTCCNKKLNFLSLREEIRLFLEEASS